MSNAASWTVFVWAWQVPVASNVTRYICESWHECGSCLRGYSGHFGLKRNVKIGQIGLQSPPDSFNFWIGELYRNWVLSHHRNHSIILVPPLKTPGLGSSTFRRTFWLEAAIGFIFLFFGVWSVYVGNWMSWVPGRKLPGAESLFIYVFMCLFLHLSIWLSWACFALPLGGILSQCETPERLCEL